MVTGTAQLHTGYTWLHEPHDHACALHPEDNSRGMVTIATKTSSQWKQKIVNPSDLPDALQAYKGCQDVYLSMNRFSGNRAVARLLEIGAIWCDLDYYKTDYMDVHPWHVRDIAMARLQAARIPAPNISISTGRGLALVWFHNPVPRAALPRWIACQKHLNEALSDLGADRMASDAARVMRVIGTMNSKTGGMVEGDMTILHRWEFDTLADEILPLKRGEIKSLMLERAKLRAKEGGRKYGFTKGKLDAAGLWEGRLSALQYWRSTVRWKGPLPPGERDNWLFWTANAMSYLTPYGALQRELFVLAHEVAGWNEPEANTRFQAVLKRSRMLAQGETIEWMGQKITPLYRARNETIIDHIGITEEEQRQLLDYFGKPILCCDRIAREYDAARKEKAHRAAGMLPREEYESRAFKRIEDAVRLQQEGLTYNEIAVRMKTSKNAVKTLLKRGRVKSVRLYGGV